MWNRLTLVTAPTDMPVTLEEAKEHCRVTSNDEDSKFERLIARAAAYIDGPYGTGFCMTTQTWRLSLDCFPTREIKLLLSPVESVSSVKYLDSDGVQQTLDASEYYVDIDRQPAMIVPAYGGSWPTHRLMPGSVKIEFVAGAAVELVPADLKEAVLELVEHWYENRAPVNIGNITSELPFGVNDILNRYRAGRIAA